MGTMRGSNRAARGRRRALGAALVLLAWAVTASPAAPQPLSLELVVDGLSRPLGVTHAGDGSGRLFVLEQEGRVLVWQNGALAATPFLDLSSRVSCCGERGLLGLAFHPRYAANGLLFVSYTAGNGDSVLSRLSVSADPNVADAASEVEILRFPQPFSNHNGGHIAFGPDGYLYFGSGDGGSGGDPQNNAQDLGTLLGKMLRLDVDAGATYQAPADNPFVGEAGAMDEIWAFGLRNPWRFSFDRVTGDLLIGDVGQNRLEEIDFQPAASGGGENYGWRLKEAGSCFEPPTGCDDGGLTDPVVQYDHSRGCSVTAGYRYRGVRQPTLSRFFVYGDFCSGRIWGARPRSGGPWLVRQLLASGLAVSSFGEDEAGRLYAVDYGGAVYLLEGRALFEDGFESGDASRWSRRRGGLEVTAPGLAGSGFALTVPVDGTAAARYVQSREPAGEESFEACFRLRVNRVPLGDAEVEIARLIGPRSHTRVLLARRGGRYRAILESRDGAAFRRLGETRVPGRRAVRLCVDWTRASAGGADGEARLSKNGRVRVTGLGLDNRRFRVGGVRLGVPAGSRGAPGGAGAHFLLDDYTSSP